MATLGHVQLDQHEHMQLNQHEHVQLEHVHDHEQRAAEDIQVRLSTDDHLLHL